jgi:tRNA 2-thiocytidine biosynthesis protein TtcA
MQMEDRLLSSVAQANANWDIIPPNHPILVGVSGGKDSLALLRLLKVMGRTVFGLHLRAPTSQPESWENEAARLCKFTIQPADWMSSLSHNPCFACSRKRREALIRFAANHGIRRIALGHHREDVTATLLLNIFFSREISTMMPMQPLFGGQFLLVRPLYLVPESWLVRYMHDFPTTKHVCLHAGGSRRKRIREVMTMIQSENPKIDLNDNIIAAMAHIRSRFLPYSPLSEDDV